MNILNKKLEHLKAFQQSKLNNGDAKLEAFFGLSKEVKFCKRCLISNQRPSSSVEFLNKGQAKITKYGESLAQHELELKFAN